MVAALSKIQLEDFESYADYKKAVDETASYYQERLDYYSKEMQKAIDMLKEVKESIINAYEIKTDLSREEISNLMDGETWFDKNKAIEMGFCDGTLTDRRKDEKVTNMVFSRRAVTNSLLTKINKEVKTHSMSEVEGRLNKIKNTWR